MHVLAARLKYSCKPFLASEMVGANLGRRLFLSQQGLLPWLSKSGTSLMQKGGSEYQIWSCIYWVGLEDRDAKPYGVRGWSTAVQVQFPLYVTAWLEQQENSLCQILILSSFTSCCGCNMGLAKSAGIVCLDGVASALESDWMDG